MFGCLVWGFQGGHLSGPLGFTATGSIEPSIPVLTFCVAYGRPAGRANRWAPRRLRGLRVREGEGVPADDVLPREYV
ncbi:hypothetical protein [Streptomyces sp. NPDC007991]|uniref:hypothetical protein n=1 Tax=Streptomyces sp. NPDC007991 TaxID=3364803 RepID=UPI0036E0F6FC